MDNPEPIRSSPDLASHDINPGLENEVESEVGNVLRSLEWVDRASISRDALISKYNSLIPRLSSVQAAEAKLQIAMLFDMDRGDIDYPTDTVTAIRYYSEAFEAFPAGSNMKYLTAEILLRRLRESGDISRAGGYVEQLATEYSESDERVLAERVYQAVAENQFDDADKFSRLLLAREEASPIRKLSVANSLVRARPSAPGTAKEKKEWIRDFSRDFLTEDLPFSDAVDLSMREIEIAL